MKFQLLLQNLKDRLWQMERGHMVHENILFASAYMRLIFGLEVEYLYFSDFRINIEKNCTLSKSITESLLSPTRTPTLRISWTTLGRCRRAFTTSNRTNGWYPSRYNSMHECHSVWTQTFKRSNATVSWFVAWLSHPWASQFGLT